MLITRIMIAVTALFALTNLAPAATNDAVSIPACLQSAGVGADKARACIGRVADPCLETPDGQSTPGSVDCLMTETKAWDDILNAEYKRLLPLLSKEAAADVTKAQRLWIQGREADCRVPYYFYEGGTIVKVLGAECERDHTADRAILLKSWREMAQGEEQ